MLCGSVVKIRFSQVVFSASKGRMMVNANGQPTRTRDKNGAHVQSVSGNLRISAVHRFAKPGSDFDAMQRERWLTAIGGRIDALSPATQRVLAAVRTAMLIGYEPGKGYSFRQYVNRAAIAQALGRSALVPYDIRMLRHLCDQRLLEEGRHPLPRKRYGDIWLGAGAEYVYTIGSDVLYCLLYHDVQERPRLLALKPKQAPATITAPKAAQPSRKALSNAELEAMYRKATRGTQRTLWERLRDWLNF